MSEITYYNCHKECADICMEKYCDNIATEYYPIKINDLIFLIPMCEKHFWNVLKVTNLTKKKEAQLK